MQIGFFCNQQRARSDVATSWQEDMEEAILADRLGFDEGWISEHTGSAWLPDALPAPDIAILLTDLAPGPRRNAGALRHRGGGDAPLPVIIIAGAAPLNANATHLNFERQDDHRPSRCADHDYRLPK